MRKWTIPVVFGRKEQLPFSLSDWIIWDLLPIVWKMKMLRNWFVAIIGKNEISVWKFADAFVGLNLSKFVLTKLSFEKDRLRIRNPLLAFHPSIMANDNTVISMASGKSIKPFHIFDRHFVFFVKVHTCKKWSMQSHCTFEETSSWQACEFDHLQDALVILVLFQTQILLRKIVFCFLHQVMFSSHTQRMTMRNKLAVYLSSWNKLEIIN